MLILSDDKNISQYFDEAIHKGADMKQAINWIVGNTLQISVFFKSFCDSIIF